MTATKAAATPSPNIGTDIAVEPTRGRRGWFREEPGLGRVPDPASFDRRLVALVPAHNEEAQLPSTLASLQRQTRPPDRIVVVADNCTDATVEIARSEGVDVFVTRANASKKAGALNQALNTVLPLLDFDDSVLVMDADTVLDDRFLEHAEGFLARDLLVACERCVDPPRIMCRRCARRRAVGAVGGVFYAKRPTRRRRRLVEVLQALEFARYGNEIGRKGYQARVLTGTASLFRVDTLERIQIERSNWYPGGPSGVYDETSLTEDNELTYAVRALGYSCMSPELCKVWTDVMGTWRELYRQRLRWQRGALDNLRSYRRHRIALGNLGQQVMLHLAASMTLLYFVLVSATLALGFGISFSIWWLTLLLIPSVEKTVTVWRRVGPVDRLVAALVVPEMAYDLFRQVVLWRALRLSVGRRPQGWG